jgi:hypothetical protein
MAVREFNGTTDELVCATGAASGMTYGTCAVLLKLSSVTAFQQFAAPHNSGGTFLAAILGLTDFGAFTMYNGADSTGPSASTTIWYLAVVRKATGTATPRFSVYNYNSTSWAHAAGSVTLADWTSPGASGSFRFTFQSSADFFAGRVAARAVWSNSLPWSADTTGDSNLQSAGLHTAASNWLSNNPSAFWLFNQAATATPVDDLSTTGTADQTSITGTTVINGDDPPGFDFALTAQGPPPVALQAGQAFPAF